MLEESNSITQADLEFSPRKKYSPIYITEQFDWELHPMIENKAAILNYLQSFKPCLFTSGRVFDKRLNTHIQQLCNNSYTDGKYLWSAEDVYCFEKYNMPLCADFIKRISQC